MKNTPLHAITILLLTLFLPGTEVSYAETHSAASEALVQVQLDTDYAAEDLNKIRQIIDFLPPREVSIKKGQTLSNLVKEQFRFGPSDFPELYKIIESEILSLNKLPSPENLQVGPLLIPGLPPYARRTPNIHNIFNKLPALMELDVPENIHAMIKSSENSALEWVNARQHGGDIIFKYSDRLRQGTQRVKLNLWVKSSDLTTLENRPIASDPIVRFASSAIELNFSSCLPDGIQHEYLKADDKTKIGDLIRDKGLRKVDMLILDSGWPDPTTARRSVSFLVNIANEVRLSLGLQPVKESDFTPGTASPIVGHCEKIKNSLAELESINGANNFVDVIYVPLSVDQNAGPLLEELLTLNELIRILDEFDHPPAQDIINDAQSTAKRIVGNLPKTLSPGLVVSSDKAIVEALFTVLNFVSEKTGKHFVVNESWTVTTSVPKFQPHGANGTIVTAAVGNVAHRNIIREKVDFARRCLTDKDVIAVMNTSAQGNPQCDTSELDLNDLELSNVVGYEGTLLSGESGTSFASPRVAWFLALGEAMRSSAITFDAWVSRLGLRLRNIRKQGTGFERVSFDPIKYLQIAATEQ